MTQSLSLQRAVHSFWRVWRWHVSAATRARRKERREMANNFIVGDCWELEGLKGGELHRHVLLGVYWNSLIP